MLRDSFVLKETFIARGRPLPELMEEAGIKVHHEFAGKGYAKVYNMPPGTVIGQHAHKVNHNAMLMLGTAVLRVRDLDIYLHQGWSGILLAHSAHEIRALTPCLWACLWDNPEGLTDPEKIDQRVIA